MALGSLVPTTELEAVNAVLADAGEAPVETVGTQANVENALNLLKQISRAVQSKGWHFNTVREAVLTRDGGNKIPVATNVLRLKKSVTEAQRDFDFNQRGLFLWNNTTNLDTFLGSSYTTVKVDLTTYVDFLNMPELARQLIVIMSARRYQEKWLGSAELSQFTSDDEQIALASLIEAEGLIDYANPLKNVKDQKRSNEIFEEVSMEVQSIGWHFNTRKAVSIPIVSTFINLPVGTLRAWKSDTSAQAGYNVAQRGLFMYDVINDTLVFDADDLSDGTLYVDLVMYLSRTYLPAVALRYIEIKAARQMQPQKKGEQVGYTERDEQRALMALQDAEGLVEDNNLLNNMDVQRTVFDRRSIFGTGNLT